MKKLLSLVLALGMTAVLLAGCGSNGASSAESGSSSSSKSGSTKARTIVIATGATGEPYSLIGSDGKTWTGIDADMWKEIASRTGWKIKVKQVDFSSLFGELDAGRVDVAANCFATTKERMSKYTTSHPYYGDAQCVIVNSDKSNIDSFAQLKGATIGVTEGQASQVSAEKLAKKYNWKLTVYETSDSGYQDLHLGRIDAMATTNSLVYKYENAQNMKFHILKERLFANNVAYFFQKNKKGTALCKEVNTVLDEMMKDGTTAKIISKWMHSDMTKLIKK